MFPRAAVRGVTIILAAAAGGFGLAGVAAAGGVHNAVVRGTVVHENAHAQSFVVANSRGRLFAIHARRRPPLAGTVTVTIRRLRNGTYLARSLRVDARHRSARVRMRGVVTFVNRRAHSFVLSARGVSMLVQTGARAARIASAADAAPNVGSVVTVSASVDDQGEVASNSITLDAQTATVNLEGTVLGIDTTAQTLTISATDNSTATGTITLAVPSTINLALFTVGQEVELTATTGPGGSYTLAGSSSDQGQQGAEDQAYQQGVQGDSVDTPEGVQTGDTQTAPTTETQDTTTTTASGSVDN